MDYLVDIVGWSGSACIVISYGLNSYQKIRSDSLLFYLLNIMGGILLIIYSNEKGAYASTFLNIVWVIIAIPAIIRAFRKSKPA